MCSYHGNLYLDIVSSFFNSNQANGLITWRAILGSNGIMEITWAVNTMYAVSFHNTTLGRPFSSSLTSMNYLYVVGSQQPRTAWVKVFFICTTHT